MPISADVISAAVCRYARDRDLYIKLTARVAELCLAHIVGGSTIRAQVTSRTKTVSSFESKLRRFSVRPDKNFAAVDDVFEGISDLAGVRIATYRMEDELHVVDVIGKRFTGPDGADVEIDPRDSFDPTSARYYRATHCQVYLPEEELACDGGNLHGVGCEIQVCSIMAQVWNEVDHNLRRELHGEALGRAEVELLAMLGRLTRIGDVTITQLLAAQDARVKQ